MAVNARNSIFARQLRARMEMQQQAENQRRYDEEMGLRKEQLQMQRAQQDWQAAEAQARRTQERDLKLAELEGRFGLQTQQGEASPMDFRSRTASVGQAQGDQERQAALVEAERRQRAENREVARLNLSRSRFAADQDWRAGTGERQRNAAELVTERQIAREARSRADKKATKEYKLAESLVTADAEGVVLGRPTDAKTTSMINSDRDLGLAYLAAFKKALNKKMQATADDARSVQVAARKMAATLTAKAQTVSNPEVHNSLLAYAGAMSKARETGSWDALLNIGETEFGPTPTFDRQSQNSQQRANKAQAIDKVVTSLRALQGAASYEQMIQKYAGQLGMSEDQLRKMVSGQ